MSCQSTTESPNQRSKEAQQEIEYEGYAWLKSLRKTLKDGDLTALRVLVDSIQDKVHGNSRDDITLSRFKVEDLEKALRLKKSEEICVGPGSHGDRIYFEVNEKGQLWLFMPLDNVGGNQYSKARWDNFARLFGCDTYTDPKICDADRIRIEAAISFDEIN
jgi:hypothetical protein